MGSERFRKASILDLGAGTCNLLRKIATSNPEATLVAVDNSDHMLLIAEELAEKEGLSERIEFTLVDHLSLPWPERRFGLIVCSFVTSELHGRAAELLEQWTAAAEELEDDGT